MNFKDFSYEFSAGPFSSENELLSEWSTGNCRRMLQWYFYVTRKLFLRPEQILCPVAYHETGRYVFKKKQEIDFKKLQTGDIIYAERILSEKGKLVNRGKKTFETLDDYIISLHTAIYVGKPRNEILHATSIEGKSCNWPLKKFMYFYKPITVKRIAVSTKAFNFKSDFSDSIK